MKNRQLMSAMSGNISLLGFTIKMDGEPTVESLQAELKTANEGLTAANEKVTVFEAAKGDWKTGIDPEHATNPNLQKFETAKDLFTSYTELQSKIGADTLTVPKDANDATAWDALATALGVPKTGAEYKITDIARPEGMPLDQKQLDAFKEKAHELRLSPSQVDGLNKFVVENNVQLFNQLKTDETEKAKSVETEMSNELGAKWPEAKDGAQKVIDKFAPEDKEIGPKILSDPGAIRMLVKIWEKMSEDGSIEGDGGTGRLSPVEARAEINKIMGDDKHPYNVNDAPGHKEAVERMTALYAMEDAGKKQ